MYKYIKEIAKGKRLIILCPVCGRIYRVALTRILTPGAQITCRRCGSYMVVSPDMPKTMQGMESGAAETGVRRPG